MLQISYFIAWKYLSPRTYSGWKKNSLQWNKLFKLREMLFVTYSDYLFLVVNHCIDSQPFEQLSICLFCIPILVLTGLEIWSVTRPRTGLQKLKFSALRARTVWQSCWWILCHCSIGFRAKYFFRTLKILPKKYISEAPNIFEFTRI